MSERPGWDAAPPEVDLRGVWTAVAAQVWRRKPGPFERLAGRLLRSPGLARVLVTTPSLLLGWIIATVVVLGAGAAATSGTGVPLVGLLAPALAAAGIAYAYGPGIDPAWELTRSMAVSDRMMLLVRALAVFGLNAALGLAASAVSLLAGGGRGRGHVRLADPDDGDLRAGAGRGHPRAVGQRGRGRGPGRLGHHGRGRRRLVRAVYRAH